MNLSSLAGWLKARWGSNAGEIDDVRMDASTNVLSTISYEHHEIHAGSHYVYRETHGVAKNQTLDHLIITPGNTRWAHMTIAIENITSSVTVSLYEATTVSANGTLQNSKNRNRNVADNNTTLIYETPTVTGVGTLLATWTLGAGKGSSGGMARDNAEYVLKQGTNYLFRVVEPNIAATVINIAFDWYEHTDKH